MEKNRPPLLIIDDEETIRTQMKWGFQSEFEVFLAWDRSSALELLKIESPHVVTLDLGLPPDPRDASEGFKTLEAILNHDSAAKVIMLTGNTERKNALDALQRGAFDYFYKPVDIDELKVMIKRASYIYSLEKENRELHQKLKQEGFREMIGNSPAMLEVFSTIWKVASTDASIIITGESGTGKELVARAIHKESPRKDKPFIPINCAAIPEQLLESELFGHEKGSFTGAHVQRKGKIEFAEGGTLFLDEIGDLSPSLQVKLLRYLQEKVVERIGGRELIRIDSRVIAATNVDLQKSIQEGSFREDLYYRLSVVSIKMPPLKYRGNDFLLLGKIFLNQFSTEYNKKYKGFSKEAVHAMSNFSWPGNVRELENKIKRAVIMSDGPWISPDDLEIPFHADSVPPKTLKEEREEFEKLVIERALSRNSGNISKAASELGVSRPTLHELIKRLGLSKNPDL